MWKEYFNYSKSERRGALVLVFLIIIAICIIQFISNQNASNIDSIALEKFNKEVKLFDESKKIIPRNSYQSTNYPKFRPIITSLFLFDPNTTDSISFLRLGLKPFMAKGILKYRRKGGQYRKPADFSKVPFIDKSLLTKLLPYIRINEKLLTKRDTLVHKPPLFVKQEKYVDGTLVDITVCDTTELKKIPGIGSGLAKSIVAYRSRLGGFYAVNQLKELKNLPEDQFQKVSKFMQISALHIIRIQVNKTGIERLTSHPYLNFYQARAIVELRKKKEKVTSLAEFSLYEEFTQKDFERLKYYLDFTL
jgi:DNA uptake protein ComE-like DNA-binding protein